ncbi:MAG: hydrogenase iron-sulfur subunit [Chloroflexota bacterium]
MTDSDLRLVAYCCEHCAYAAADLAGGLRIQYPPEVNIVQIPCSGKMDELIILRALEDGVDGVMVAGCLPRDCHYLEGNVNAQKRVERIKELLVQIGFEPERVEMYNLSSAMANKFAEMAKEMVEKISTLGPNPLRKGKNER